MSSLPLHTTVTSQASKQTYTVISKAKGAGGQGAVYQISDGKKIYALKWYQPEQATTQQKQRLQQLLRWLKKDKELANDQRFVWPQEIITSKQDHTSFGYLMDWIDTKKYFSAGLYVGLVERSIPFAIRHRVAFNLAEAFHTINVKGLVYADINFGNIHFDRTYGDIKIIDNDNVVANGEAVGVIGTARFKAPELVTKKAAPSIASDRHALAVFIYHMLFQGHPLEGLRETQIYIHDEAAERLLFGTRPLFIHHRKNDKNKPVASIHKGPSILWPSYPKSIRDVFHRAFVDGLKKPEKRISATQWRRELLRLDDKLMGCSNCGVEVFFHPEEYQAEKPVICWNCTQPFSAPLFRFEPRIKDPHPDVVFLGRVGSKLFPHHLDPGKAFDFNQPWAEVVQHPQKVNVWGLKNHSPHTWQVEKRNGEVLSVAPQRSAPLAAAKIIDFTTIKGLIKNRNER